MSTYTRGISVTYGTGFLMQNVSIANQADQAEARDNDGNVAVTDFYNERDVLTFDAILPDGASKLRSGEVISYDSILWLVQNATVTRSNTDYPHQSVTAVRYIDNGIPASSSSSSSV